MGLPRGNRTGGFFGRRANAVDKSLGVERADAVMPGRVDVHAARGSHQNALVGQALHHELEIVWFAASEQGGEGRRGEARLARFVLQNAA